MKKRISKEKKIDNTIHWHKMKEYRKSKAYQENRLEFVREKK